MLASVRLVGPVRAVGSVWFLVIFLTALFAFQQTGLAQNLNTANGSESTAPTPAPEPTPIPLSSIVTEADSVAARLREIRLRLTEPSQIATLRGQIPELRELVDAREPEARSVLASEPALDDLRQIEQEWQELARNFPNWKRSLREQIAEYDKYLEELAATARIWALTVSSDLTSAETGEGSPENRRTEIPAEITQKIAETRQAIAETLTLVEEKRTDLVSLQARISELEARTTAILDEVYRSRELRLTNLLVRDDAPIWIAHGEMDSPVTLFRRSFDTVDAQAAILRAYAVARTDRFALHAVVLVLLIVGLYWARSRVRPYVKKEPKLATASQIFELPVATGLIISVLLSGWLYPQAPRLLSALLGAAALVPVVILLRRLVDRSFFTILNVLVAFYFIDRLREILAGQPFAVRIVFLLQMLAAIAFLLWFLKSKRLESSVEAQNLRAFTTIRRVIPFAAVLFALAFLASFTGFVSLGEILGNGLLGSAYAAIVVYTLTQIVRSATIFALRVPPLSKLSIVKNNRVLIRERTFRVYHWIAIILWALIALDLFSLRDTVFAIAGRFLGWSLSIGSIEISVGDLAVFALTIWIAVLVSRFIRFVLEEDIYPRIDVGGGVSYSISTVLHYGVLVLAFLFAIAALGVDFTKFAIVAGAVGIGVGFGLQNIINNFVSGLILLFERPVKVGDTVQLGEHIGSLKRIGLRASVLRKIDGSDVVVPNSQLISEEVINWTMSDKQRRVDIPVGVAYGSDPEQVIELLVGVTREKEDILLEPPAKAFFLGFGDNSLDFELRFWTENTDRWVALRSELVSEIYKVLTDANIEIPFPQRDIHIKGNWPPEESK
ncbi:MAG TPA: mechanosensitive ion channel [Pyrinomonadaceae bacterium]|nr:mechanosensitive ion channel [Pyrinomonadaceae bacterium]HMP65878.1 mechanosensitive ion channel [Pyrinomonadaceae bacterium]